MTTQLADTVTEFIGTNLRTATSETVEPPIYANDFVVTVVEAGIYIPPMLVETPGAEPFSAKLNTLVAAIVIAPLEPVDNCILVPAIK